MVVRREGGSVGGIAMKVFGAPQFTPGEEVVVFIERRGGAATWSAWRRASCAVLTGADGNKASPRRT